MLFIALVMILAGNYFRHKLTEEIESLSATIIACMGLLLFVFFAPLVIKLLLFAWLLIIK